MIPIILNFSEQVLQAALASANDAGLSLQDYISGLIRDDSPETTVAENFTADVIAAQIYDKASIYKVGDQFNVEDLHRLACSAPWTGRTTGQRISIGRAFKKLADAKQLLNYPNKLIRAHVTYVGKDQQNRAVYVIEAQ